MAAAADAELLGIITQQADDFLTEMQKDIKKTKEISEQDRQNCEAICLRIEAEQSRLKIEYLIESLHLFDRALKTSDQQILKQIRHAWSILLESVTRQCKTLAGPLLEVLQVLSRRDKILRRKYAGFVTGAVLSSLLVGATVALIIAHCHPGCIFHLAVELLVLVAGGAIIALLIAVGCIRGSVVMTRLRAIYRKCSDSVRLMLVKYFPDYFDGVSKDPLKSDLATVIKNSIDTLNIKEDLWVNQVALEMIKRSAERQLQHLRELKRYKFSV